MGARSRILIFLSARERPTQTLCSHEKKKLISHADHITSALLFFLENKRRKTFCRPVFFFVRFLSVFYFLPFVCHRLDYVQLGHGKRRVIQSIQWQSAQVTSVDKQQRQYTPADLVCFPSQRQPIKFRFTKADSIVFLNKTFVKQITRKVKRKVTFPLFFVVVVVDLDVDQITNHYSCMHNAVWYADRRADPRPRHLSAERYKDKISFCLICPHAFPVVCQ